MNLQLQKSSLIKKIELINDADLLKTVKSIIDYGLKNKDMEVQELIIPEWQKKIVRDRRKNTKREDYINLEIIEKKLDKKYGVK